MNCENPFSGKEILSCLLFYLINEKIIFKNKKADQAELSFLNPA